ncbi:hypothetical protein N7298_12425 [Aeromonas caviae]|nr:hypothetical protein [Aeromonas caviae]MDH0359612.1 hypothetical protein [Aeromonas caviae]
MNRLNTLSMGRARQRPSSKGALGNQKAGQVIHHYGAAPAKLEGNKKDGDAKQAGQQQLDAGP